MQLYLQIQQISADIRDYLQIWQLSAQCMCIPPCHTVASNYWSKQIYLQIWLLSADKVPICRYPSYLQICRYGENLADIYLQIYRQVYRQIISADWTIGRTLLRGCERVSHCPFRAALATGVIFTGHLHLPFSSPFNRRRSFFAPYYSANGPCPARAIDKWRNDSLLSKIISAVVGSPHSEKLVQ